MYKILVSGKRKGVGKTTLIRKLITNLKGDICVIKSSVHQKYDNFELIDNLDIIKREYTDTALFKEAKAKKVYYLKTNKAALKENIIKLSNIKDYDYLIVEGNSIIDHFNFDLVYYIDKKGGDAKYSADRCKKESDLIVDSVDQLSFKFNLDQIDCLKAHQIGHSFGIPIPKIGNMLNKAKIKVNNCQLGLF